MDSFVLCKVNIDESEPSGLRTRLYNIFNIVFRVIAIFAFFAMFISDFSPMRITSHISKNHSLFSSSFSYSNVVSGTILRQVRNGTLNKGIFILLMAGGIVLILGILALACDAVMSLGNNRLKNFFSWFSLGGSVGMVGGVVLIYISYTMLLDVSLTNSAVNIRFANGILVYAIVAVLAVALSVAKRIVLVNEGEKESFKLKEKHLLFIYFLPIIVLTFLFSYLPLYGWRYALFDYTPGPEPLAFSDWQGLKWFTYLFKNPATRADFFRAMKNTIVMSSLGIATSFLPVAFAIFFAEIKNKSLKKVIQTITTLPYFISWILVYAVALALFKVDGGLLNSLITKITGKPSTISVLTNNETIWLQMLLWGIWKGLGWSAIIYIAAIAGIDQQMYEAASIDGAKRFGKMWHITVPSLMPTFSVMLLLAFAGILSNGLEQYLVFDNAGVRNNITVLDLYVYKLGLGDKTGTDANLPLATVVSMGKSVISIMLLFLANWASKRIRGESII